MCAVQPGLARPTPTVEAVARRIEEISTLPHVALQVVRTASDDSSSAADLKKVMENDIALSARILRCVNSSAYALRTKITNLQHAITYLGMKQIRNLAITASVADLFKKDEKIGQYRRQDLWRHLVSVGICARLIAMRRKIGDFEDAFLAGLMHDIGIVLEDQHVHAPFSRLIQSLNGDKTLIEAERSQLSFDHTTLGGLQGPTVAPVVAREHLRAEGGWYAVNIVVRKERLFEAVGELRAIGGSGVVVVPCAYIFEEEPERYGAMVEQLGIRN